MPHWERSPETQALGNVGECNCGHGWSYHGRRKPPSSPLWESTGCKFLNCNCMKYSNKDGTDWPFGVGP